MLPVQRHPAETETGGAKSKCGQYWVLGEMEIQNTRSEIIIPNLNHSVSFIHSFIQSNSPAGFSTPNAHPPSSTSTSRSTREYVFATTPKSDLMISSNGDIIISHT